MDTYELEAIPCLVSDGKGYPDIYSLWTENDDGDSQWKSLRRLAQSGWDLVAVTPLTWDGNTRQLLFTFKRLRPALR